MAARPLVEPWLERQLAALTELIAELRRRFRPEPETIELPPMPVVPPFQIGVATFNNDVDQAWTRALVGTLENRPAISCKVIGAALATAPDGDQVMAVTANQRARYLLMRDEELDLILWGDVHEDGYSLWFTPAGSIDDDRPGSLGPYFRLELAPDQEVLTADLLNLALLTAIEPVNPDQTARQRRYLAMAFDPVRELTTRVPVTWNLDQQRTALVLWGHAAATVASWGDDPSWYNHAADAYRRALQRLPRGHHGGIEESLIHRNLAGVLMASGEPNRDTVLMEQAVNEYRAAAETLTRALHPTEWGNAHNRLGLALYKLDLLSGRTELLKESMVAYQQAIGAFTRLEQPQRWAEVMTNLGQAMLVYGDQVKSPEVLERAVEICRSALDIRDRARAPLAWAASQNALGTALFLLDKLSLTTEHLDESAAAFAGALEVFTAAGMTKQAQVTEKNLAHARRLMKVRAERKVALLDWEEEPVPAPSNAKPAAG